MILKIALIIKTAHLIKLIRIPDSNRNTLIKIFLNNRAKSDLIFSFSLLFNIGTFHNHLSTLIFNIAELSTVLTYHLGLLKLGEGFKTVYFRCHSVLNTLEFLRVFIWKVIAFLFLLFIALLIIIILFLILNLVMYFYFFFQILLENVPILLGLYIKNVFVIDIIVL
jgi:hypothetical protein